MPSGQSPWHHEVPIGTNRNCLTINIILLAMFSVNHAQLALRVTGTDLSNNQIAIQEGRSITITCTNLIIKNPVSWDTPLALDMDEYQITSGSDDRSASLYIPSPKRKHRGQYKCSTRINKKEEFANIVLAVSTDLKITKLKETDKYIELLCDVLDTYPLPFIIWYWNGISIEEAPDDLDLKVSDHGVVKEAVLQLRKPEGVNTVTCEGHGPVSSKNASLTFGVTTTQGTTAATPTTPAATPTTGVATPTTATTVPSIALNTTSEPSSTDDNGQTIGIVIGAMLALFVLTAVIGLLVYIKRKQATASAQMSSAAAGEPLRNFKD